MTEMTVNDLDIGIWKARLLEFSPSPYTIKNDTTAGTGTLYPTLLHTSVSPLTLTVVLDVYGRDMPDAERRASDLLLEMSGQCEIGGPDGYYYRSILQSSSRARSANWIVTLTVVFQSVRHGTLVTTPLPHGVSTVWCGSNVDTECVLQITAQSDGVLVLRGFTPTNLRLQLSAGDVLTVDGILKTITDAEGNNRFSDAEISSFPKLSPGTNTVQWMSNGDDADYEVSLQHYPTFL